MTPAQMSEMFKKVYAQEHFEPETRPTHDFDPLLAFVPDGDIYKKELEFRAQCRRLKLLPAKLYRIQDFADDDWPVSVERAEEDFLARCRELNLI